MDFGFDDAGAIGDLVFADDDGDGAPDPGESGIPGITVRLYDDANGNGVVDAGEPLLATAVTDASGAYVITGLPAGDYVAVVDDADPALPAGYEPTTPLAVAITLLPGSGLRRAPTSASPTSAPSATASGRTSTATACRMPASLA